MYKGMHKAQSKHTYTHISLNLYGYLKAIGKTMSNVNCPPHHTNSPVCISAFKTTVVSKFYVVETWILIVTILVQKKPLPQVLFIL